MTPIEHAREAVIASRTPPFPDTLGRQHRDITADAIRRGDWDAGRLVQDALARVQP